MNTLAGELPREIARVSELLGHYKSLPNGAGNLGAGFIQLARDRALKAIADGDLVGMLQAYAILKEIE